MKPAGIALAVNDGFHYAFGCRRPADVAEAHKQYLYLFLVFYVNDGVVKRVIHDLKCNKCIQKYKKLTKLMEVSNLCD